MPEVPENLAELLEFFDLLSDRADQIDALTSFAERLEPVPESIAQRPYPESHRVPVSYTHLTLPTILLV